MAEAPPITLSLQQRKAKPGMTMKCTSTISLLKRRIDKETESIRCLQSPDCSFSIHYRNREIEKRRQLIKNYEEEIAKIEAELIEIDGGKFVPPHLVENPTSRQDALKERDKRLKYHIFNRTCCIHENNKTYFIGDNSHAYVTKSLSREKQSDFSRKMLDAKEEEEDLDNFLKPIPYWLEEKLASMPNNYGYYWNGVMFFGRGEIDKRYSIHIYPDVVYRYENDMVTITQKYTNIFIDSYRLPDTPLRKMAALIREELAREAKAKKAE